MTQTPQPQNLTLKERMKLDRFYYKRYMETKKRRAIRMKELGKSLEKVCKVINKSFWICLGLLVSLLIAVFAGLGSEHIIYVLNKPLGLGYANFASYVICALTFYLLRSKR